MIWRISVVALAAALWSTAQADVAAELSGLVGYKIVESKTIASWSDADEREEAHFKGCSVGRVIVFTDGTKLTCSKYGYQFAYRPIAIILSKEIKEKGKSIFDLKMIVGHEVYDMRR